MPTGIERQAAQERALNEQQLVVFKVADEEFGVDINEVKEIIRWEDVTRIPNTAPYIKGVINLRGNIIVVNDLAMKLGLPSKNVDDDTRIIVVEVGDETTVGMIVDSATEVLRLPGDKIRDAPSMITDNIDHEYIKGVGLLDEKRLLTLLDLARVLQSKDYEQILRTQENMNRQTAEAEQKRPKKPEPKEETKSKPDAEKSKDSTTSPEKNNQEKEEKEVLKTKKDDTPDKKEESSKKDESSSSQTSTTKEQKETSGASTKVEDTKNSSSSASQPTAEKKNQSSSNS